MTTPTCDKSQSLNWISDATQDVYTHCTLPKGHDGEHRATYSDDD